MDIRPYINFTFPLSRSEIQEFQSQEQIKNYLINSAIPFRFLPMSYDNKLYFFAKCSLCKSNQYLSWVKNKEQNDKYQLLHFGSQHLHESGIEIQQQRTCQNHLPAKKPIKKNKTKKMEQRDKIVKSIKRTKRLSRKIVACESTNQSQEIQEPILDKKQQVIRYLESQSDLKKLGYMNTNRERIIREIAGKFQIGFGKSLDYIEEFMERNQEDKQDVQSNRQQKSVHEKNQEKTRKHSSADQNFDFTDNMIDIQASLELPYFQEQQNNEWYNTKNFFTDPNTIGEELFDELENYFAF